VSLVATDAIVLHAFDYRETSRILRLATRDAGICSVIARGARRPKSRFGSAVDLFAEGAVQMTVQGTRDLHLLTAFDVTRSRAVLAARWERFAAASALSELLIKFAQDDAHPALFDAFRTALDALEIAEGSAINAAGIAGAWTLIGELGFSPSLDSCAACDVPLRSDVDVRFSHRLGGAVCEACAARAAGARRLPPHARAAVAAWLEGGDPPLPTDAEARAHLRLLREFVQEHLGDGRPLRAFAVWEHGEWQKA
jgi:DNA repair protein RecO (recombination protein O)